MTSDFKQQWHGGNCGSEKEMQIYNKNMDEMKINVQGYIPMQQSRCFEWRISIFVYLFLHCIWFAMITECQIYLRRLTADRSYWERFIKLIWNELQNGKWQIGNSGDFITNWNCREMTNEKPCIELEKDRQKPANTWISQFSEHKLMLKLMVKKKENGIVECFPSKIFFRSNEIKLEKPFTLHIDRSLSRSGWL